MLIAAICNCSGSETQVRSVFKKKGLANWLEIPVFKGRDGIPVMFNYLPPEVREADCIQALARSLKNRSSYAVIIGYDENGVRWSDVRNGDLASRLDAEIIVEQFA